MPRITRKRLKFTEDSMNELIQETYNDTHNLKAEIQKNYTQFKKTIKDNPEYAAVVGQHIINLLDKQDKLLSKKIDILKFLKDMVVHKDKMEIEKTKESPKEKEQDIKDKKLSVDMKNELIEMLDKLNKDKKQ